MMNDLLSYLLKVSGVFIVLYMAYNIGFSRLTFHTLNRMFLMAVIPLSLIIPALDIAVVAPAAVSEAKLPYLLDNFGETWHTNQSSNAIGSGWDMLTISFLIYGSIVILFISRLLLTIPRIMHIKHRSNAVVDEKYTVFYADVPSAFSCFNWIFLPRDVDITYKNAIIKHEKLHGRAYHTFDLVIAELYIVVFWFNPFVYLFRKDLKSVHEFQIDSWFLKNGCKPSDYLKLILKNLEYSTPVTVFCNNFNGSTIKKRITMIAKSKSSGWKAGRFLLLLPLIAIMTMSFSLHKRIDSDIPCISPIKAGNHDKITSGYGMRIHPISKEKKFHYGMDFSAKPGTPIVATAGGIVIRVVFLENSYGKLVEIDHGEGFITRYAQLNDFAIKEGDRVKKEDVIGYVGQSGLATGPHLHYEVLKNGKNVNPADYIPE